MSLYIYRDLMIDNCTGIDTQTARTAGELVPVTATITNKGNLLADRYFVQLKVNGQSAVIDTVTTALKAGETGKHAFRRQSPSAL